MKRSVRSSRVTGPKMRVPSGSELVVESWAALPSKRSASHRTTNALGGANHHGVVHLALLDATARRQHP